MPNKPCLTANELEAGLILLDQGRISPDAFWGANLTAFRQALRAAIQETSDLLLAKQIPPSWRREFEAQLADLQSYVDIVECYTARRAGNRQGASVN